jgi:hypothetical protein
VLEVVMEVCVDIDDVRLCKFDRAAQAEECPARWAIAVWLAEAHCDAALVEQFDTAPSRADQGIPEKSLTSVVKYDNMILELR